VRSVPTRPEADRRARFEAIAGEVYEPLQRYLARRATPDDAADVLADTLLVVWRRLDEVPDEALPWSYGVARRCLANHRRGAVRRLRLVERAERTADDAPTADPQAAVERSDPELLDAIGGLTESEREVVHLWAWERLEPREIAAVLDTTPNAVSVALTRAKRKLAERLDRQDRSGDGHLQDVRTREQEGGPR
jgi:RNA polymerase sigma-70 factor (ECF subfamily)